MKVHRSNFISYFSCIFLQIQIIFLKQTTNTLNLCVLFMLMLKEGNGNYREYRRDKNGAEQPQFHVQYKRDGGHETTRSERIDGPSLDEMEV